MRASSGIGGLVMVASCFLTPLAAQQGEPVPGAVVDLTADPDQTVLAGQAFRADLFGGRFEQAARDRRDVKAWDLGAHVGRGLDGADSLPLVSLYFWQHAEREQLFRALLNGVSNELFFARDLGGGSGLEWVATLETSNWPGESGEWIDGQVDDREKLVHGFVRPGLGLGIRRQLGPAQENMFAADLIGEVGALWFGHGDSAAATFETPDSTPELRLHGKLRLDLLARNLIELPHAGWAAGADAIFGHRVDWSDWGDPAIERRSGHRGRNYSILTGYVLAVDQLPFVDSPRHRLIGALHAGIGDGVDRFSAVRIGGGPDTRGGEYDLTARPVLPGAAIGEFFPENYALAYAGYRYEPSFFAFVDAGATIGQLDRDRAGRAGRVRRDDSFTALSLRLSSGFFGSTRVQLITAYNFDVVRRGEAGALAVMLQVSGYF